MCDAIKEEHDSHSFCVHLTLIQGLEQQPTFGEGVGPPL